MKVSAATALVGFALGFALSRIGFSSWDEVHDMFTFASPRLMLAFATGVVALALVWRLIGRFRDAPLPTKQFHPGIIPGGVLFGVGWALSGSCPSIALVQLGEGQLGAVLTLGGIFAGNWLYSVAHEHWFRWSARSCAED